MSYLKALDVSASGLSAQRLRMNLISSNLANVNTTRGPDGGPYQRKEPVFGSVPVDSDFKKAFDAELDADMSEVEVVEVVTDKRPPILKYEPNHPDANEDGFVAKPNINIMEEMVNLMTASRSYEANVMSANATKSMALKALEIGK